MKALGRTLPVARLVAFAAICLAPALAQPDAPRVRVVTFPDRVVEGELVGLGPEGVTLRARAETAQVPLARLVECRFLAAGEGTTAGEGHLRLELVGGERLLGAFAAGAPDGIVLDTPEAGPVEVPFEAMRALVVVPPGAGPCHEPEHGHPPRPGEDVAYLTSGDAYAGLVLEATPQGLSLEDPRGRVNRLAWEDLLLVHLANDALEPAAGLVVETETRGGSRLVDAAVPRVEEGALVTTLRSLPERTLRIPLASLDRVRAWGGDFVYATDLPFESEFVPFYEDDGTYDPSWQEAWYGVRVNRRPNRCPLRLGGIAYRHGFAVHSLSRVTLPLDRGWARFHARFGIDDWVREQPRGDLADVDARVIADGEVLWEAKGVGARRAPLEVGPLDVGEVVRLVLEVDYGQNLHVLDRAAWVDPLLERK